MREKFSMQAVKFRDVNEFLEYLPQEERVITEFLRNLVLDCIPNATEKLSFNVPYYRVFRDICFIWPASVLWGKKKTYEGVRFGFVNGNLLLDEQNYLNKENRKQVYWRDFTSINEVDVSLLRAYLYEALIIDEEKATAYRIKMMK